MREIEKHTTFDFRGWAEHALRGLPESTSDEEMTLLRCQVRAIEAGSVIANPLPPDPTAPQIVRKRGELKQIATQLAGASGVVIDLETSALNPRVGEIVGLGLAVECGTYYVPINHRFEETKLLRPDQLTLNDVVGALHIADLPLVAHNAKFELRWLRWHAGVTCKFIWDTLLAARLLRSDLPAELKDVATSELDVPDWGLSKFDIARIQFLPIDQVARYCAKDCWYTAQLLRKQHACLV